MLTICYCTRNVPCDFSYHIKETIGLNEDEYEVLVYVNDGEIGLSKAYNKMLSEAKFRYVLFVHDDVEFLTPNWGEILIRKHKAAYDYSMIGLAGCKDIPASGKWWDSKHRYGIIKHTLGSNEWTTEYSKDLRGVVEEVKLLDGLFLSVDKNLFDGFDEDFDGFHFYDIGTCVNVSYRKGVITDIRVKHNSIGELSPEWEKAKDKFMDKFKSEIGTYAQSKYIPFIEDLTAYESKSVTVALYFDNNANHKLVELIQNIYNTNYPEYNYEVVILNNTGQNLTIDRDIKIIDFPNISKIDVISKTIRLVDTEYFMFIDSVLQPFGDVLFEIMKHNANDTILTSRIHLYDNSIRSQGIGLFEDENKYVLKNYNFGNGFDYGFEPMDKNIVGITDDFFITPTKLLKGYLFLKSELGNEIPLFGLEMTLKQNKIVCVNNIAFKSHNLDIDPRQFNDKHHKDNITITELIKKYIK